MDLGDKRTFHTSQFTIMIRKQIKSGGHMFHEFHVLFHNMQSPLSQANFSVHTPRFGTRKEGNHPVEFITRTAPHSNGFSPPEIIAVDVEPWGAAKGLAVIEQFTSAYYMREVYPISNEISCDFISLRRHSFI